MISWLNMRTQPEDVALADRKWLAEDRQQALCECQRRAGGAGGWIEDDVLVTEGEPDVLTAAIPKRIADVEAACAG